MNYRSNRYISINWVEIKDNSTSIRAVQETLNE